MTILTKSNSIAQPVQSGTFSPVMQTASGSFALDVTATFGNWWAINNLVFIWAEITWIGKGDSDDTNVWVNLPFTVSSDENISVPFVLQPLLGMNLWTAGNAWNICAQAPKAEARVIFNFAVNNGSSSNQLIGAFFNNTGHILLSGSYYAVELP